MSEKNWAEREIEIACKERIEGKDGGFSAYYEACCKSALKALKSLMEDGHSGMSIGFTRNILNRLIEGKPLTPITDTEEVWVERHYDEQEKYTSYRCARMSSLFKDVYDDGTIKYTDVDNQFCIDVNDPYKTYHNGFVRRIIDEMFPITFPYYPTEAKQVYCEDFLTDERNGDFDTQGILYVLLPDGEKVEVNRYFREGDKDWVEITEAEYKARKNMAIKREAENE